MQENHPIAYFTKALGVRASNKPIYEKELMAIEFVVQEWFTVTYNLGKNNLVEDAISQRPQENMELGALLSANGID